MREKFIQTLLEQALAAGCDAAEAYAVEGMAFSVNILEGEVDSYTSALEQGLGLRVQAGGKNGYAYTESFDNSESLIAAALENARAVGSLDEHPMQTPRKYPPLSQPPQPLLDLPEAEKIALARRMEQAAKAADPRITRVTSCVVGTSRARVYLCNTLGLLARDERSMGYCMVSPVAEENGRVNNAHAFRTGAFALDVEACAKEAAAKAAAQLCGAPVAPGEYRVLFQNEAAADILEAFSPMFSADNAQKGLSLLASREGQDIAAAIVSIVDDPFEKDMPLAFDGEGTPCQVTTVMGEGKLLSLLHNLKTAQKAGTTSTGNAGRSSAAVPIGVSPTNFYILPGEKSLAELERELGTGLLITDVSGLHAGVNPVSGEFSLLAKGYLVENGRRARAVERITVGGTFLGLLQGVIAIGNDLFFGLGGPGRIGAPSLLVNKLLVSGEA